MTMALVKCGRIIMQPSNGTMKEAINKHVESCLVCQKRDRKYLKKKINKLEKLCRQNIHLKK